MILLESVFGNGLNYLFCMYFVRTLSPADFGLFAPGMTVFNIVVLFGPLGMESAVMKFVSQQGGSDRMASALVLIKTRLRRIKGYCALLRAAPSEPLRGFT